jgi:hypothetical protein
MFPMAGLVVNGTPYFRDICYGNLSKRAARWQGDYGRNSWYFVISDRRRVWYADSEISKRVIMSNGHERRKNEKSAVGY